MWGLVFTLSSVSTFLILSMIDTKEVFKDIKNGFKKSSNTMDRVVKSRNKNILTRFFAETESRIQKSNIRVYIPYNSFFHVSICIAASVAVFYLVESQFNYLICLMFAAIGFISPYIVLQKIAELMSYRARKYSVDFLIILKNCFNTSNGDIFKAFKSGKDFFIEPLRTHVGVLVYEYENKISAVQALDNFAKKFTVREIRTFAENLKICHTYGGDVEKLIDEYINDMDKINDDLDKEDLEDTILNNGLYALLALNFYFIQNRLTSGYRDFIANTTWGTIVIAIDLIVCIYIINSILRKEV